ncbi:MAG: CPBP family intramembrane metalloprotease [Leptospiraceae bacterium]|nr:CPBP family intramembrane metalloprotease [Leptospiraceae bacterium]
MIDSPDRAWPFWKANLFALLALLANLLVVNLITLVYVAWHIISAYLKDPTDLGRILANSRTFVQATATNPDWIALTVIAGATVSIMFIFFLCRSRGSAQLFDYLGLRTPHLRHLLWSIPAYILLMAGLEALGRFFDRPPTPEFMQLLICNPGQPILLFVAVSIAAPVFEELLFRGLWYRILLDSRLGLVGAMLLPNLLWAGIHLQYDWFDISMIFLIGFFLTWVRYKSKSLPLVIFLHFFQNTVSFFAAFYLVECT